jgi:hypothetical protein
MSAEYPTKEVVETHGDTKTPVEAKDAHHHHHTFGERVRNSISVQSLDENTVEGQIFSMNDVDPALDKKMRLVNNVGLSPAEPNVGYIRRTEEMLISVVGRPSTRSAGLACT